MRKRSELGKKPSAVERTTPIPGTEEGSPGPGCDCPGCGDKIEAGTATRRPDGKWECPHCGMPLKFSMGGVAMPDAVSGEKEKSSPRGDDPPKEPLYCGECGSRLTVANAQGGYTIFYPCGHTKAQGQVDDPKKSKNHKPAAGSQISTTSTGGQNSTNTVKPLTTGVQRGSAPEYHGPRIFLEWPESMFRVGEFNTFRTEKIALSFELGPDMTVEDAVAQGLARLEKLADDDFDKKSTWYLEKLGFLHDKMKGRK